MCINNYNIVRYLNRNFLLGTFSSVCTFLCRPVLQTEKSKVVLTCSLHDIALLQQSPLLRNMYDAVDYYTTDGMPLVWLLSRLVKKKIDRVYAPDVMEYVFNITQGAQYRHLLYGSTSDTLQKIEDNMRIKYPQLNIIGKISPPFSQLSSEEEKHFIDKIISLNPTFVWVGLGSPKQVIFASRLKNQLKGATIFCIGAGFDFIAKTKPQAPKIIQKVGLEWLFRLITEPKRLWRRYIVVIILYYLVHFKSLLNLFPPLD